MGISRYTAYVIQSSDSRAESLQCGDGKYQGVINIYKDGFFHTTILSTQESFYDSAAEAVKAMQEIIDLINATDLATEFPDKKVN